MTSTARPAPPAAPAPYPVPGRQPRPPRRLGLGVIARLTARELRARRTTATVAAAVGVVAGVGLAGSFDGRDGTAGWAIAVIVLLTVSAALADATDPVHREEAILLVRLGCPRAVIWLSAWAASVCMLGIPAAAGSVAAELLGWARTGSSGSWSGAVLLAGVGAATTAGTRLAHPATHTSGAITTRLLTRAGFGLALLLLGSSVPALSETGSDLDLTLPIGTVVAIAALVVLAPIVVLGATAVLARMAWATARMAASSLREQRRGLTIPVAVVASVTIVLLVQSVVGQGLGEREQARLDALAALGPATVGGGEQAVQLGLTLEGLLRRDGQRPRSDTIDVADGATQTLDPMAVDAAAGPGAVSATIDQVQAVALPPGGTVGNVTQTTGLFQWSSGGPVALATPDLLRALGLDPDLASSTEVLVLDDRVLDGDGTVHLVGLETSPPTSRRTTGVHHPARDVVPGQVWAGMPAVLLPDPVVSELGHQVSGAWLRPIGSAPTSMVVRFPDRPDADQVDALSRGTALEPVRGNHPVDLTEQDRTDRISSVWVRTPGETQQLTLTLGILTVVALTVALASLRLAVRRDDALLVELGARRRTSVTVAALRGAALAGGAVLVGAGAGAAATALGLWRYDHHSRFAGEVVLAPIGWHLPAATWVGLLLLPVLAAAIGAVLAAAGPVGRPLRSAADDR